MLHAVNRKKARIDAFRGPGLRVPLEDVVSSTVFGPLLFIDQAEAEAALSLMLASLGVPSPVWSGPAHLAMWPKRKTTEALRSSYVEPDVEFADAVGNSLIVEVKWGAPLSESELAAQWLSLGVDERRRSRHILLVLETKPYQSAIERDRATIARHCELPWHFHCLSWRRLADAFREMGRDMRLNGGTRRWAQGVHGFLRREDARSLAGWDGLDLAPVEVAGWRFSRPLLTQHSDIPLTAWRFDAPMFRRQAELAPSKWRYRD